MVYSLFRFSLCPPPKAEDHLFAIENHIREPLIALASSGNSNTSSQPGTQHIRASSMVYQ